MIVYLRPRAPFATSVPRSDTLFGAIAWAIRLLYGEGELIRLLEQFDQAVDSQSSPPFLISSLFPFIESENGQEGHSRQSRRTLFLPRPLLAPNFGLSDNDRNVHRLFKRLNRSNWISLGVFNSLASGELSGAGLWEQLSKGQGGSYRLQAGAVMTAEESAAARNFGSLIATGESVHNSIGRLEISTDRETGQEDEVGPFYAPFVSTRVSRAGQGQRGQAELRTRTGLFFLIRQWPELETVLQSALRFLGDRGFGGDASIGRGHCEVEFEDGDFQLGDSDGDHLISLSLLHPSLADREHFTRRREECFARLERRKGFIESAYAGVTNHGWKPTLVMLAEGAVFPRDGERRLYGSLYKEQELRAGLSERVRINGLGYTVPMRLAGPAEKEASS